MIIDIHTHTFPEKIATRAVENLKAKSHTVPFSDGTVEGLRAHQKACGIDLSVIVPVATNATQVMHINESAARLNEKYEGELLSFGAIHPDSPDVMLELKRVAGWGLKGIKIHPVYQEVDIDDIRFLRVLDAAASLGLVVITHGGEDIGYPGVDRCSPKKIRHALTLVGKMPFIAAHMGGWNQWDEVPEQLSDLDIYLDTAFSTGVVPAAPNTEDYPLAHVPMLNADRFMVLAEAFGMDHILFGTDSPWGDAAKNIRFIRELPVAEEEKEAIFAGNAAALLQL